ncbi:hypothetical protein, partial [Wolbachia endosymbiont of Madathamugadia hiepei]|uniref:hypothetical protein n=1 Tax=Wolbachia endosymbiont of Madathamugadia hiepei TaxID=1241303 RepID=UPI001C550941
ICHLVVSLFVAKLNYQFLLHLSLFSHDKLLFIETRSPASPIYNNKKHFCMFLEYNAIIFNNTV